jgi:hypothetical protein
MSRQKNIHGMIILTGNPHQLIKSFLNVEQSKIPSETTPSAESTPIINMEELSKFDFDVKKL